MILKGAVKGEEEKSESEMREEEERRRKGRLVKEKKIGSENEPRNE